MRLLWWFLSFAVPCIVNPPSYPQGLGPGSTPPGDPGTGSYGGPDASGAPAATNFRDLAAPYAGTHDIPVTVQTAGQPQQAPAYDVPDGYIVEVVPLASNTVTAFVNFTNSPNGAKFGPRMAFITTATAPRQINIRNLFDCWVFSGVVGEGVVFTIKKAK